MSVVVWAAAACILQIISVRKLLASLFLEFRRIWRAKKLQRGGGKNVEFFVMDAENMKFPSGTLFDVIWAIESISHFPHKEEFFRDAVALLKPGGKFILADWFQSEGIKHEEREKFIEPIERGMLTPRIEAMSDYERLLKTQGIEIII